METVKFANICLTDLAYLFSVDEKTIRQWVIEGLLKNADGSFTLSRACRWIMAQHKEVERQKVQLSKISQKDLIALTGVSRQTIFTWTEQHGLPRNPDMSYDLKAFVRWIRNYYDQLHRDKYRKTAQLIRQLADIFKE